MKIYRVEDEEHRGPYTTGHYFSPGGGNTPAPWDDRIVGAAYGSPWIFGFANRKQLARWFYDGVYTLSAIGFSVAIYECDPVYVQRGQRQVAFLRDRGKLLRTERLNSATIARYLRGLVKEVRYDGY